MSKAGSSAYDAFMKTSARRARPGLAGVALFLVLFARPAFAQLVPELSGGPDEVILKNGGMVRGTIVTVDPEKSVTIFVMLTGEQRNIPWAEVERIDRGKFAASCPKLEAPKPEGLELRESPEREREREAAFARNERGVVRVLIDSTEPGMQLYRVNTNGSGRVQMIPGTVSAFPISDLICISPCEKVIDGRLGEQFFFGARGMPPSSPFQVFQQRGTLAAHVEPGSDARFITGVTLGVVGGLSVTFGSAVWILGYVEGDRQKKNVDGTPMINASGGIIVEHGPLIPEGRLAGPIAFGIGAAMLVGGIFLGRSGEISYSLSPKPGAASLSLSPAGFRLRF